MTAKTPKIQTTLDDVTAADQAVTSHETRVATLETELQGTARNLHEAQAAHTTVQHARQDLLRRAADGEDVTSHLDAGVPALTQHEIAVRDQRAIHQLREEKLTAARADLDRAQAEAQRARARVAFAKADAFRRELNDLGARYEEVWEGLNHALGEYHDLGGQVPNWISIAHAGFRIQRRFLQMPRLADELTVDDSDEDFLPAIVDPDTLEATA